jgi:Flp pilus assembly protein TadD
MGSATNAGLASRVSRGGVAALVVCALLAMSGCAATRGAKLYRAGTRALAQGDTASAIVNLEQANELLPGRSEILNHLGIAYQSAGRSGDALSAFEQAVEADCDNAAAQSNLVLARQRVWGATSPEPAEPDGWGPPDGA